MTKLRVSTYILSVITLIYVNLHELFNIYKYVFYFDNYFLSNIHITMFIIIIPSSY